jgi:hypothetical protein
VGRWRSWNSSRTTAPTPRSSGSGQQPASEDALGDEADPGGRGGHLLEADLVADAPSHRLAELLGDAGGGQARGEAAGLEDPQLAVEAPASRRARGTRVVLPAPGAATRTSVPGTHRLHHRREERIDGKRREHRQLPRDGRCFRRIRWEMAVAACSGSGRRAPPERPPNGRSTVPCRRPQSPARSSRADCRASTVRRQQSQTPVHSSSADCRASTVRRRQSQTPVHSSIVRSCAGLPGRRGALAWTGGPAGRGAGARPGRSCGVPDVPSDEGSVAVSRSAGSFRAARDAAGVDVLPARRRVRAGGVARRQPSAPGRLGARRATPGGAAGRRRRPPERGVDGAAASALARERAGSGRRPPRELSPRPEQARGPRRIRG